MGLGKTYSTQYLADSNNNTGVAGQVLISTATGVNWSDGTGIIGGPYLPLSAGSGFPLTDSLYIGSSGANGLILKQDTSAASNSGRLFFQTDTAAEGVCIMNANGVLTFRTSSDPGATSGNIKMVLTNGGNLGIGNTDPSINKLQVNGQVRVVGAQMIGNSTASNVVNSSVQLHIKNSAQAAIRLEDSDADNLAFDIRVDEGVGFYIKETVGGDPGDDTRLLIEETTGFVGIGTESPSAPLNVFAGTNESLYDVLGVYNSITGTAAINNGAAIRIGRDVDGSYSTKIATIYEGNNPGYLQPALAFYTMYNTNLKDSETEKMRISANGNVGIGFTGPGASPLTSFKLSVNGNAYVAGDLGIGTVLPASKLDVSGDFSIEQSLYWNNGYNPTTGAGVANGFDIAYRTNITALDTALSYKVSLTTNGTGTDTGSCWLVGYTNGSSSWSVRMVSQGGSNSNHPLLAIDSTGTKMVAYTNHSSVYGIRWHCETTRTGDPDSTLHNYGGDFHWQRNGNELIYNDGNVGINTTDPENLLHVQQAGLFTGIHTTAGIRVKSSGASAIDNYHGTIALSRGTGSVAISAVQEDTDSDIMGMAFFTHPSATGGDAAVEQMRLDQNGNLAIGTQAASEKLEVAGNIILDAADARLKIKGGVTGTNSGIDWTFNSNTTSYAKMELDYDTRASTGLLIDSGYPMTLDYSSGTFSIKKNGSSELTILNGKVGINETNPVYTLHVDGSVNAASGLYSGATDQNSSTRYAAPDNEIAFARTTATTQWFKVIVSGGSPVATRVSITSAGDNTNMRDEYLVNTAGYGFYMHIQRLPGVRYNSSKLLAIAAVNPSNGGGTEIWIKMLGMTSGSGTTVVASNVAVRTSAQILASATTSPPTLTPNDTQLDISTYNRNYSTLMCSRGGWFGDSVAIGLSANAVPGEKLEVAGNMFLSNDNSKIAINQNLAGTPSYGYADGNNGPGQLVVAGYASSSQFPGVMTLMNRDSSISANQDLGVIQFVGQDDTTNGYASSQIIGTSAGTPGSGSSGGGILRFLTTPNSTGGMVERMRIDNLGNVTIQGTATATNFILSSDKTLKDNIEEIDAKHIDVKWKNFELKSEPGIKRSGVIAQELEKTNPEFVRTDKEGLKSVAYIDLLITKIAELEARLEKAGI